MRGFARTLTATALLCLALTPATARADFGFEHLDIAFEAADGSPAMQAGSHPFALVNELDVNVDGLGEPEGSPKDLEVDFPPGLVADPKAIPRCATVDFLTLHQSGPLTSFPSCPNSTAIGFIAVRSPNELVTSDTAVAYNLAPAPGSALKLGFRVLEAFVTIEGGLRPDGEFNAFAALHNIAQIEPFAGSELTIWGNPAAAIHDAERGDCFKTVEADTCPTSITVRPFLTLPTSCTGPLTSVFKMRPWQNPGTWVTGSTETHDDSEPPNPLGMLGCGTLGFAPHVEAKPTTDHGESPSGLDFNIDINDEGLTNPDGIAHSTIKKAVVTMPEGMTINPSIAAGLATCSEADLGRETLASQPGEGCPQASKVGTVEVESPLLEGELVKGQIFVATQDQNLVHSMIALYMVIKHPELGILVKLPGKVEPDPQTGRLVTIFGDPPYEVPQIPFSHFRFHFREGGRSPLVTPRACGTYTTEAVFTPWANPESPLTTTASFQITKGVGGGPCPPAGVPSFKPGYEAGSLNNEAGAFSPFYMRLTRADGDQDMTKFSSVLPPGVVGSLKGVGKCPDAAIEVTKAKSGRQELAAPSCPASSQIGRTLAGAGVGSALTYVPGQLYLAGPYKGDPLSVVSVTPAVAGPFDAGAVVVRLALDLNPQTAEVEVDGAASDPIPHILKGIVLKVRDIRVYVDRPNFTLNPTNCDESSARATLFGGYLDVFSPQDDVPVDLSVRYQAANCLNLGFKPSLKLNLRGGTKRGDNPGLKALFRPRPGDANTAAAKVTLPRSAFLDQSHIRTICTRVQFAAESCPKGSIYGHAKAVTPLLEESLEGPVILRSSSNKLPDLVVALKGLVDVNVSSRVDSFKGGIRNTFEVIPDAPVTEFTLTLQGGNKGLIVNSRNLCEGRISRVKARFTGQNGRAVTLRPRLQPQCGGKR